MFIYVTFFIELHLYFIKLRFLDAVYMIVTKAKYNLNSNP